MAPQSYLYLSASQIERYQEAQPPTQKRETLWDPINHNLPRPNSGPASLSQVSCFALLGSKDVGSGILASTGWTISLETEVCGGEVWGAGPGIWKGVTRHVPKENGIKCQAGRSP